MKTRTNQSGFSAIESLLVLIIFGMISFVGWFVWHTRQANTKVVQNTTSSAKSEQDSPKIKPASATLLTYTNDTAQLTYKYPNNWSNNVEADEMAINDHFVGFTGVITSPNGNKLTWVFRDYGGKGGDCTPAAGDVPFASTNQCASKQIINVEKVQSFKPPTDSKFRTIWEDGLYITHSKYQSPPKSTVSYQICLDPYLAGSATSNDQTPHTGTIMGLLFPCAIWVVGFNAQYSVKNLADFNSADAKTAEQIMKTFRPL